MRARTATCHGSGEVLSSGKESWTGEECPYAAAKTKLRYCVLLSSYNSFGIKVGLSVSLSLSNFEHEIRVACDVVKEYNFQGIDIR